MMAGIGDFTLFEQYLRKGDHGFKRSPILRGERRKIVTSESMITRQHEESSLSYFKTRRRFSIAVEVGEKVLSLLNEVIYPTALYRRGYKKSH
jgi:hypothetical protein